MKIGYRNKRLQKACQDIKEAYKLWGPEIGKKVHQRVTELAAFDNLAQAEQRHRLHQLSGKRAGELSVNLTGNWRFVFSLGGGYQTLADGGIDRKTVEAVIVEEIVDLH